MSDKVEFVKKLEDRTSQFALKIIQLSSHLGNTPEHRVIRNQLTKAGTSIGANYREANRSRSKADFKNRIKICLSEASETQYWLEIVKSMKWYPNLNDDLINESGELVALFTSISKKL